MTSKMSKLSFHEKNVGYNTIFNNASDRLKSYLAYCTNTYFYVMHDLLKMFSVMIGTPHPPSCSPFLSDRKSYHCTNEKKKKKKGMGQGSKKMHKHCCFTFVYKFVLYA